MNRLVSWLCKIFVAPIVQLLFIKDIRGRENIPRTNFILVSNHQSHLDWIVDGYLCVPRRFHFIGQTDQYSGPLKLGLYILYFVAGVIGLNRKSAVSKKKVIKEAIKVLKDGDSLILYPEGTRTRTGEMGAGKHGTARFFLETGVPILPVAIKGTFKLLPPGGKLKVKKTVEVNVGKPLYFENEYQKAKAMNKDSQQYKLLLLKITDIMMEKIAALKKELGESS